MIIGIIVQGPNLSYGGGPNQVNNGFETTSTIIKNNDDMKYFATFPVEYFWEIDWRGKRMSEIFDTEDNPFCWCHRDIPSFQLKREISATSRNALDFVKPFLIENLSLR